MDILNSDLLQLLSPWAALNLMGEEMLARIVEDPSQPMMKDTSQGFGIESIETYDKRISFLDLCRQGQANGARRMDVFYDFFFGGNARSNYPDSPMTVKANKVIYDILQEHGMGMGASLISPLDIGGEYVKTHRQQGQTMQFQEGLIRQDGSYETVMDYQTQWTNNKGPVQIVFKELKVFAFDEERIGRTPFYYVNEDELLDISDSARFCVDPDSLRISKEGYGHGDIHIQGITDCGKSRFLAVVVYYTQEIDYFADDALDYMKSILDLHKNAGIHYDGLYSDEMHIQFDWESQSHFGETEVTTRYMTDSMARAYAEKYGAQYRNFAKYLVYFTYMHHDFLGEEAAGIPAQHVLGKTEEDIIRTYLLRRQYAELLHSRVVDLCCQAKAYAEQLFGKKLQATGHSTWQESPCMDLFCPRETRDPDSLQARYDYTPRYVWSAAQRENISACNDHFKWNDYFWAVGTDIPEGGFLDRNYFGAALTSGLAALNSANFAYYCIWGDPDAVKERMVEVGQTYGHYAGYCKSYELGHNMLQGYTARLSDVLSLYPMDLNFVEERFGNWMVQYGYTDYISEEKLLEYAKKPDGPLLRVKDRRYRALVVFYAPLMSMEALKLIGDYARSGGTVIWCAAPALRKAEGVTALWKDLFGIQAFSFEKSGIPAEGQTVHFGGMPAVADMRILTNLLPDHVYPVTAAEAVPLATMGEQTVGTVRTYPGGGKAVYLGFRPRDDQSRSLGEDADTLFSILREMGCYEEKGCEVSSRPAGQRYIYNRFANGSVSLANHFRTIREQPWAPGFYRDEARDEAFMKDVVLPPHDITLEEAELCGRKVTYRGEGILTYRYSDAEGLLALGGRNTCGIRIDGKAYTLTPIPVNIIWGKLDPPSLSASVHKAYILKCDQQTRVTLPFDAANMKLSLCRNYTLEPVSDYPFTVSGDATVVDIDASAAGKWMVFYQ